MAQLSQDDLADRLSITKSAISQWELGNKSPRFELWPEIRRVLGVSLDRLICGEPKQALAALHANETESIYQLSKGASEQRTRQLVTLFNQLGDLQQKAVIDLLRSVVQSPPQANPQHIDSAA